MTQDHAFTLIVSAVGIAGALTGIVIGHFLTRWSQHRQWMRDRRLEEYKAVLSAVNEMFEAYAKSTLFIKAETIEQLLARHDTIGNCFRTIANCIIIADDLSKINLLQALLECQNHFSLTQSTEEFGADRRYVVNLLIGMAKKSLRR